MDRIDRGRHPGGDRVKFDYVGRQRDRQGHETAQTGDKASHGGDLEVLADDVLDGLLFVGGLRQVLCDDLVRRVEHATALDPDVEEPVDQLARRTRQARVGLLRRRRRLLFLTEHVEDAHLGRPPCHRE